MGGRGSKGAKSAKEAFPEKVIDGKAIAAVIRGEIAVEIAAMKARRRQTRPRV